MDGGDDRLLAIGFVQTYEGVTSSVVQQAAEQLVQQYDQARQDIAAVGDQEPAVLPVDLHADTPFPTSDVSPAEEQAWEAEPPTV